MKYKLDFDDQPDFEGWAFIHFRTLTPGYVLADSLNRLYDYTLARIDDMPLHGAAWPLYRHKDTVRHIILFLAEQPAGDSEAPWEAGDKLLVIKSEMADTIAHHICADFTDNTPADPTDLLARDHALILDSLLENFTVATPLQLDATPASRKAQKELAAVVEQCDAILTHIEQQHLDLSDDERLRLELLGR